MSSDLFMTDEAVCEWPRNGDAEPVRWVFRPMTAAEKLAFMKAQTVVWDGVRDARNVDREGEPRSPDDVAAGVVTAGDVAAASAGVAMFEVMVTYIAKLTVRVENLMNGRTALAWPDGTDEKAREKQRDIVARVRNVQLTTMYGFITTRCAGLGEEALGN